MFDVIKDAVENEIGVLASASLNLARSVTQSPVHLSLVQENADRIIALRTELTDLDDLLEDWADARLERNLYD